MMLSERLQQPRPETTTETQLNLRIETASQLIDNSIIQLTDKIHTDTMSIEDIQILQVEREAQNKTDGMLKMISMLG